METRDELLNLMAWITNKTVDIRAVIEKYDLPAERAEALFQKYSREYHRMLVDLKYEGAERLFQYMRRLEEECLNDSIVIQGQSRLTEQLQNPQVVFNIQNHYEYKTDKQFVNFIQGDFNYGIEDETILALIEKYGQNNQELINALNTLKDEGIKVEVREKEKGKLQRFLEKIGDAAVGAAVGAAADVTIPVLIQYIKGLIVKYMGDGIPLF